MVGEAENTEYAVMPDSAGCFRCQGNPLIPQFYDAQKQLLEVRNLPSGSWPILFQATQAGGYLYFSYFLSQTVHRWEIGRDGSRLSGSSGDRGLIDRFLQRQIEQNNEDFDPVWLHQKLIKRRVSLNTIEPRKLSKFYRLEFDACEAIMKTTGAERSRRFAKMLLPSLTQAAENAGLFRLIDVPAGYDTPFEVSDGDATSDYSLRTSELNLGPMTELSKLLAELEVLARFSGLSIVLGGLLDCPDLAVKITVPALAADYDCEPELLLYLSSNLVVTAGQSKGTHPAYGRIRSSLPPLLYHLAAFAENNTRVCDFNFDLGDEGRAGHLSFDRPLGSNIPLIPDLYLLRGAEKKTHYIKRPFTAFMQEFQKRAPILFWRGSTTGRPFTKADPADSFKNNPRIAACLHVKRTLGDEGDAKITKIVQMPTQVIDIAKGYAIENGVWGAHISEQTFGNYRFYLDLPGNSCAWGTYRKFLLGCLVIRPSGTNELFYYRSFEPSVHYLAASADLSDLQSLMLWVKANERRAAEIAYAGRNMMINVIDKLDASIQDILCHEATLVH